jgi:hypothetical protein
MGKHIVLSVVGVLLGLAALAWIQPNTSAGATFLLTLSIALVNAVGYIVGRIAPGSKGKTTAAADEP